MHPNKKIRLAAVIAILVACVVASCQPDCLSPQPFSEGDLIRHKQFEDAKGVVTTVQCSGKQWKLFVTTHDLQQVTVIGKQIESFEKIEN